MKTENVSSSLCLEFNADSKTVLVFVLALIIFDFSSFELKKNENHNFFFKNYIENQEILMKKSNFLSILHMLCQFHQDRFINEKSPHLHGSVPLFVV